MSSYRAKKNKIARKYAANIFEKERNPSLHRIHPPGQHGARRQRVSAYGTQLREKQKLKAVYGLLTEKALLKAYKKANRSKEPTSTVLIQLLESRLDVVVYRLKLAPTIFSAQQMVSHRHITVDGKIVNIRSFTVKPGMKVELKNSSKLKNFSDLSKKNPRREVPSYLSEDGQLINVPEFSQIPLPIEINVPMICELIAYKN